MSIPHGGPMKKAHNIALLGAGLIGTFYTLTVHGRRSRDRIKTICAVTEAEAEAFAKKYGLPNWTADMKKAVSDPEIDLVIIGVPNYLHKKAITLAANAGKAVLCTKPLGRSAAEALDILKTVEKAGVFAGYL